MTKLAFRHMIKNTSMNGTSPKTQFSRADIVAQLQRLCSSPLFARAAALQELLRYLVIETAEGRGKNLSREHVYTTLAAKRLKLQDEESLSTYKSRIQDRLDLYYASATGEDLIRISMRPDSFKPEFSAYGAIRPVVGRDSELMRFREFYSGRKDELSIVSIGGISGIGKTTLAEIILNDAAATGGLEHVVSVHGPNDPRSGQPYLPFRDSVVGVVHEFGKTAGDLRQKVAPSWSNASFQGLASELGVFLQELTKRRRSALFIDNFHLADYSSEGLLSELARTWSRARILIVLAFRESEMRSVGHPYSDAERRLAREGKCLQLRPQSVTLQNVREYLAKRFPVHLFPPDFARVANEYSQGIPLHLVDLIDHLEHFEIVPSNGHWALSHSPDQIAGSVSELGRHHLSLPLIALAEDQRQLLSVASLLGESFDSTLLALVTQAERGTVERALDIIYRSHRIIVLAYGPSNENPHDNSVRYRFSHSSYRDAFLATFETLPTERARLANRAVDILSQNTHISSATHSARIAALLEAAGRVSEAAQRYAESAQLSSSVFAHGTAALLARRAISLLGSLGEGPPIRALRMNLNILLGLAVMSTSGFAAPELEGIYQSVNEDALALQDPAGEKIGLYGQWVYSIDSGRIEQSLGFAQEALARAVESRDLATEVEAHYASGTSLIQLGRFADARNHFAAALENADELGLRSHWFYQLDAAVSVRSQFARALWFSGQSSEAVDMATLAFEIAQQKSHPESRAYALVFLADLAQLRRDCNAALDFSAKAISAAVDCGASQELAWAQMVHAWALGQKPGEEQAAIGELAHGFAFYRQLNAKVALTKFYCLAAEVYLHHRRLDESILRLNHAREVMLETNEVYFESELYRIKAEILLAGGDRGDDLSPGDLFRQSYRIAARLEARPLQLRAALGLYRHRQRLNVSQEEAWLLIDETCAQIPNTNNDIEVLLAREIIGNGPDQKQVKTRSTGSQ